MHINLCNAQPLFNLNQQFLLGGNNYESAFNITKLNNGTFVMVGYTASSNSGNLSITNNGNDDCLIVNFNSDFTINWQKAYGGSGGDNAYKVVATNDGGFICGGSSVSSISGNKTTPNYGSSDVWVLKFDNMGNLEWQNTYGGNLIDNLKGLKKTSDGNYIICALSKSNISGTKTTPNIGGNDYWVFKIDGSGNVLWEKTIGGVNTDNLHDCTIDDMGNIYLVGNSISNISGDKTENNFDTTQWTYDVWLVKLTHNGDVVWDKTIGTENTEKYPFITFDGRFIYVGTSISPNTNPNIGNITSQSTSDDFLLTKIDTSGFMIWDKNYGGNNIEEVMGLISINSKIILYGKSSSDISGDKTENSRGMIDAWCLLIDGYGNVLKDKTIGGLNNDFLYDIYTINNNRFILLMSTQSSNTGDLLLPNHGASDIWLIDATTTIDLGLNDKEQTGKSIYVYPNPVISNFTIYNSSITSFILYNINGQKVMSKNKYQFNNINISHLPSGVYLLVLNNDKGIQETIKIVKR
jgi:hypothetical protein